MTKVSEAIFEQMAWIVLKEGRSFTYGDFKTLTINGQEIPVAYGTYRNIVSKFKKEGKIELDCRSSIAFYTLKGYKFGNPITPNHTVVHTDPLYKMLQNLPFDKQTIHDIRFKFEVPNISKILAVNPDFHKNKRSKDIMIPSWSKENAIIKIIIHQTDVVSVIIGCSLLPIPLDVNGIIRFFTLLIWAQTKLEALLNANGPYGKHIILPDYKQWKITMWHFGRDALIEYSGDKFSITVEQAEHILARIYVKSINGKNRIRIERQDYPKKNVLDAIEEKLNQTIL
jgi:hypothetical protein